MLLLYIFVQNIINTNYQNNKILAFKLFFLQTNIQLYNIIKTLQILHYRIKIMLSFKLNKFKRIKNEYIIIIIHYCKNIINTNSNKILSFK